MQFDDFDKKIKDAAEHHHPAYDEKAWNKMESLLDKHLPVKKDNRRRFIFFLLFLFILGSGAWLFFRNNGQTNQPFTATQAKKAIKENTAGTTSPANDNTISAQQAENKVVEKTAGSTESSSPGNNDESISGNNKDKKEPVYNNNNQPETASSQPGKTHTDVQVPRTITRPPAKNKNTSLYTNKPSSNKVIHGTIIRDIVESPSTALENNHSTAILKSTGQQVPDNSQLAVEQKTGTPVTDTTNSSLQKTVPAPDSKQNDTLLSTTNLSTTKKDLKKPRKQKVSPLAVTFTAGPDLSFVGISELGKVKMKYGAGLSYTYKKFTLRSGFYVTHKIYSAAGADYHPYYPDLEKVEGDCKVFEIPVTVSYNFVQAKNHNWFAATGLSSYLMKKETYDYSAKDPGTGMTNYWSHTWDNKNKHYFSVLNISAGYERKFSRSVSLIAEPYLQVPLTGIGNGKMKLNSGGLLITLSVRPFTKR